LAELLETLKAVQKVVKLALMMVNQQVECLVLLTARLLEVALDVRLVSMSAESTEFQ